mgnify:FL=1|jgi:hypothetical protein
MMLNFVVKDVEKIKGKTIMRHFKLFLQIILLLNLAFSWGKTGHRTTGEVAEHFLTKKTKIEIKKILQNPSLAIASTWSDEMRSNPDFRKYNPWHYANMPLNITYANSKKSSKGDIVQAIKLSKSKLKDNDVSLEEKAFYLRYLVHLIGDIHQPLHVGRGEDRGGNDIKVKWFGDDSNLHRVWDTNMIDNYQMSYTELSSHLLLSFSSENIELLSENEWIDESQNKVKIIYSNVRNGDYLGYDYIYENFDIVKIQLFTAGYRLAGTLNEVFDE